MPTYRRARAIAFLTILCAGVTARADQDYPLGPDSQIHADVPHGKVTQYKWDTSKVFPGTERDYWVYIPAQYDPKTAAAVMIFQDGGGMVSEKGQFRATVVMDNLIAKKEMPVTVGIFINPGVIPTRDKAYPRFNRSFEYDTPDGT